ncbi:glutathione S-transferase family protein [Calothrix sp. UHCC 0171]|uniref:glutathione S-transferase family protein n=1 Tax=Calothrix sp. UHCC 0171 TaxID=3110245 RepID=UPI002B1E90F8|nr:glutathione S-transferase N-terminal domain-containing protein [Calothrix sp. UHCC 0171]MEA5570643.1 glutathione S-transferase N-terminal domain-containing protein [Calothrix sp. UHCC 0171]
MNQQKPFRLITIPVSHYCEKVRWALTRMKFNFIEEPHTPPFHTFVTAKLGGKTTPILVTDMEVFTDSTDIFKYLDSIALNDHKLYPNNPELRQQVEELEELFDSQLGIATRRWGYSYINHNYKNIQRAWCKGVPRIEKILLPLIFPYMQKILKKRFDLTTESSQEAYAQIKIIFAKVSELLADGRNYLVGDKFSAADLTFAALAAPIIQPPEHPIKPRPLAEMPVKMASEIEEFRETPAGKFVLRLYRERNI